MDYANTNVGTVLGAQAANQLPTPELGRLKFAAERVAMNANRIDDFIARFHGPLPDGSSQQSANAPDSYRNDLETLFKQIERLDVVVAALSHIG